VDVPVSLTMSHDGASQRIAGPRSPRDQLPTLTSDEEGEVLLSAVSAVPATFRELFDHDALLGPEVLAEVRSTLESVERRLGLKELCVAVAGERRSGKSTLLDAIVGDRLLGGARGAAPVVTLLRRRDEPNYRARFASGNVEEFAERVPDKVAALDREAAKLEEEFGAAQRDCHELGLELASVQTTRGQVESEVECALSEVEAARALAAQAGVQLAGADEEALRVEREIDVVERDIPASLRSVPPRSAFVLWLWYLLYLLFYRARYERYRGLLAERERTRARRDLRSDEATEAADARALAEARFQPLHHEARDARRESTDLAQALRDAEAERDRLRSERASLRSEREHLVSERWRRFFTELSALSKKPDLVELSIDYPARLLPEDVTIIDVPGMLSDDSPEWQLIRERADGCILVSELDRGVSEAARSFLRRLREVVPHVLLVLTKMDQAYQRGMEQGKEDPWGQIEHARRIGTRRFARELGRAPDRVLSVSVAAESMFTDRESELARRSESELDKLFVLLRRERAIILGAHAAGAIRRCIARIADAQTHAERAYRERILELERQRTPEPAAFRAQALESVAPAIATAARAAIEAAGSTLADSFRVLAALCDQIVAERSRGRAWLERVDELAVELAAGVATARADANLELEAGVERGVSAIERELFEALRARYQLLHEVRRATSSSPRLDTVQVQTRSFAPVVADVRSAAAHFGKTRWALGAGGAITAAFGAAFVHPWLGPLVGGTLGAFAALFRRETALRELSSSRFRVTLDACRESYAAELLGREAAVAETIRLAVERSLERAMIRFGRFIAEPLEAEREALESERMKLADIELLRDRIREHDRELERLLEAARRASVGLCRASA
jgi:hypothetical protein